jgi:carbonic anhydrase/acetyltransferase-like protein (isoleucine patch superfamily)
MGRNVFVARGAIVVGAVEIGDFSSIWYNAVVRGDINSIRIGKGSNIQDNVVLHLADDYPCILGDYVTVGHSAIIHAATVKDESLIGMGAVVLDGAEIGPQCLIGAKTLIPPGKKIPEGSLVMGIPGKIVRSLDKEERASLRSWADKYVENARFYLENGIL